MLYIWHDVTRNEINENWEENLITELFLNKKNV